MDKLFDSVNGSMALPTIGKELRCAVTKTSCHWDFWKEALTILKSMKFDCRQNKVVSIKSWIETLEGIMYLSKKLLSNGFDFLVLRNLNQDPIENFFCSIRSHGLRNINPTCWGFISSFKSLLISNLTTKHSVGANCETDNSEGILDSLRELVLLNDFEDVEENIETEQTQIIESYFNIQQPVYSNIQINIRSYVTGWIIKKIKPLLNNCKICQYKLTSNKFLNEHNFINLFEYEKCKLNYPTSEASNLYSLVIHFFNIHVSDLISKPHLKTNLILIIRRYINIESLLCPKHDLKNIYLKTSIKLLIFSFIKEINYILNKGELKSKYTENSMKISALKYNKTYKSRSQKIKTMKTGGK